MKNPFKTFKGKKNLTPKITSPSFTQSFLQTFLTSVSGRMSFKMRLFILIYFSFIWHPEGGGWLGGWGLNFKTLL